ncbi:hypothetical protein CASFOL_002787 [Castilleja foliolosa]|uniref:Uncharacterized protein n=1 Tax=Castilleja foliolosa TaxID=1961234 RepID=A0ABD3EFL8_9LAMI
MALDGGDMAEENARMLLFGRRRSSHAVGGDGVHPRNAAFSYGDGLGRMVTGDRRLRNCDSEVVAFIDVRGQTKKDWSERHGMADAKLWLSREVDASLLLKFITYCSI